MSGRFEGSLGPGGMVASFEQPDLLNKTTLCTSQHPHLACSVLGHVLSAKCQVNAVHNWRRACRNPNTSDRPFSGLW